MEERPATMAGVPVEVDLGSPEDASAADGIKVKLTDAAGIVVEVPAFVGADGHVRVRYAAAAEGRAEFVVADSPDGLVGGGEIDVEPYVGDNQLYKHGRVRAAEGGRHLEHADGTPFLWIADTWWMGLTPRLDWPAGFQRLLGDRVAKGFNVVQIVAGPLPDFPSTPDGIWHEQQANEGGWSWQPEWAGLNAAYFDAADRRIAALVDAGVMPCIVGMWGYYGTVIGAERARRHWREIVARYAAYPVAFVVAGEFDYPGYDVEAGREVRDERREEQLRMWSELVADV